MDKRKRTYLAVAAVTTLLLVVSETMAFFSGEDFISNRFSAKQVPETYVRIAVDEIFDPPSQKTNQPFQKDVKIRNTGTEDCYIRVRLAFSTSEYGNITDLSADGESYIPSKSYTEDLPAGWVYSDGFYYYTSPVAPNAKTETSLFSWVKVNFPNDPSVLSDEFHIFVYAEAVQVDDENGNPVNYQDAWVITQT